MCGRRKNCKSSSKCSSVSRRVSVEWKKGQQDISGRTLESGGMDAPSSSSALEAGPLLEKWAWGSSNAEIFRPTWGVMKGYDDLLDDRRADAEWAEKCDEQKRIVHDKNLGSGRSPPPKGMGRKTAKKGSKAIEEQLWGRE